MQRRLQVEPDGTKVYLSTLRFRNAAEAWSVRAYNADQQHYQMRDAHYDKGVPAWIRDVSIPLVKGKGMPTIMYLDLLAMRVLGIELGGLARATIYQVHDLESVLQMQSQQENTAKVSLEAAFRNTRLHQMRYTTLLQSGHRIKQLQITGRQHVPIKKLLPELLSYQGKEVVYELLKKYGLTLYTRIPWRFNVELHLEAI